MAEQIVELQPGESKVATFEAIPHEVKTYQVSVNGLSGSFVATKAPPGGEITSLTWDSPPPFIAGERHRLTIRIYNSTRTRQLYNTPCYDNGTFVNSAGGGVIPSYETKEVFCDFTFTPGTHEIRVDLFCEHVKVDEKTLSIIVKEVAPPPGVIDGEFRQASAWYEGLWHGLHATNNWPAGIEILFSFSVTNTGEIPAMFRVSFMGKSCYAYIRPGNYGTCSFKAFAIAGTHNLNVYGDSKLVDSHVIQVTTYESLVANLRPEEPLPLPRKTI